MYVSEFFHTQGTSQIEDNENSRRSLFTAGKSYVTNILFLLPVCKKRANIWNGVINDVIYTPMSHHTFIIKEN